MALGLTIIFGLLDVINMAHGECYALGAYLAVSLLAAGVSFWVCLAAVPLVAAAVGYAAERSLIQRVFHSRDRHTLTLLLTFGVALAALSGVLLAPVYSVFPTMGKDFILLAFSVVIVGGMGSIKGAVIAGLVLTQIQSISSLYISPVWSDPLVFGIMVLFLMLRPQGLAGRLGHG